MDKQIKVKNIPTEVKIERPDLNAPEDRFNPRNRIYVRAVTGLHQLLRQRIGFIGMLAFMALPWINFNGQQAVLFDLIGQKFNIFGLTLWPQDFTILIAKDGAGGKGHMGAVIQDGEGKYYYVTMGAAENAGLSTMASEGVQGGMQIQELKGVSNMDDAVAKVKTTDTNNSEYTDQVTFKTDSKTDQEIFDSTMKKATDVNSGEDKYNVLTNNCTDACERPIEDATGVELPDGAVPNSNFEDVKENKGVIQMNLDAKAEGNRALKEQEDNV